MQARIYYQQKTSETSEKIKQLQKVNQKLHWIRAGVFLSAVGLLVWLFTIYVSVAIVLLPLFIAGFGWLMAYHSRIQHQIEYQTLLKTMNEQELEALDGNLSAFDAGENFKEGNHDFAADMDLFANGGIFQMLNRAVSVSGKTQLAKWLKNPVLNIDLLQQRQQAFQELSRKTDWRQQVLVESKLLQNTESKSNRWIGLNRPDKIIADKVSSANWLNQSPDIKLNLFTRILNYFLPAMACTALVATIAGYLPFIGFILFEIPVFLYTSYYLKQINAIHGRVSHQSSRLKHYVKLLKLIEEQNFDSQLNKNRQQILYTTTPNASGALSKLSGLVKALDNRLNLLFAIIGNGLLLWDMHYALKIQNWKKQYGAHLNDWFDTIAKFEAACGPANFAFNNPDFAYPTFSSKNFIYEAKELGHPLIPDNKRICNDFSLNTDRRIAILTGANMAGKSTFLRTVGVNLILAMNGMPTCSKAMNVSPIKLFTSVRIDDSLMDNESYFFAELKRLQSLIHRLDKGEQLLVIIDEMLRGTNSNDKHKGSVALVKQIYNKKATGIVATHDIALGQLTSDYPELFNCRFEVDIADNQLLFDYKLRNGISQNLNATFLMQQMGIIPDTT